MRIEPWMKRPVHTVKLRDTAAHARRLLEQHRINQLPVVVDGRLVGIVTDRDLRDAFPSVLDATAARPARTLSPATAPENVPVEDVMSRTVVTLTPTDLLTQAARLMRRERIGAIPIVEGERVIGILTRSDLLDAFVALADRTAAPEPEAPGRAPKSRGPHGRK
jgi:acetoin utilization protein AcuB